jgi:hypothetical protein
VAVTNESELIAARLAGDRVIIDKASNGNQTANTWSSLWLATGIPAAGSAPTTAAICTKALTGAIPFTNPTAPAKNYLSDLALTAATASQVVEVWDRVAHMGGLSLTSTTSQTVNLDLHTTGLNPSAARVPDMSEVEWWLETYADGGATASNATVNVTFTDSTSADLSVIAVGGTLRARRLINLRASLQAADANKVIRDVNTVILSASTTTAGNFGFTATRRLSKPIGIRLANFPEERDYLGLGLMEVPDDACLMLGMLTVATSTGTLRGFGRIARG